MHIGSQLVGSISVDYLIYCLDGWFFSSLTRWMDGHLTIVRLYLIILVIDAHYNILRLGLVLLYFTIHLNVRLQKAADSYI